MGMSGSTDDLNSEINVTPMVDIMLVLLIIFMVTAPLLNQNQAVDINLPQAEAENVHDNEGKPTLTIKLDGNRAKLKLNGVDVTWVELDAKLQADEKVKKFGELYIGADNVLPYQIVLVAMAQARKAKIGKVMLLTEQGENVNLPELDKNIGSLGTSK
ncbi:MAG: biopolymer transporter ExbD [Deltaproteobacteria bacterium]|nr:biopolymer transporter ExbD [Deltaproteobacteria bacterium]